MEDCIISGFFRGAGIFHFNSGVSNGNLAMINTSIIGCGAGIWWDGLGLVSLRNVTLQGNLFAMSSEGGAMDISCSLITQNTMYGLWSAPDLDFGIVNASDCMISGNGTGVYAEGLGLVRLTNDDIFNNTTGIVTVSSPVYGQGVVSTAGNNRKAGNGTPGNVTPGKVIVTQ